MTETNRRTFLKSAAVAAGAAGVVGAGVAPHATAQQATPQQPGRVAQRRLGKLGADVGVLGAGLGSAFTKSHKNAEEAAATLARALDTGVNYFDTARSYGPSEELIGPFVKQRRDEIFLVSKSGWRDHDGFRRQLEESLNNLQTESIDLYHLHNLKPNRDGDLAEIERGAVAAARKAKEEGLIKAFGVTGHSGAAILMRAIDAWDPDALLTVFNVNRSDAGRYEDELLPMARERNMGIVGMKTIRHVRDSDLAGPDLVRYAISLQGVHSVIVGLDTVAHLDANVAMATGFEPMAPAAMREMSDEVRRVLAGHPEPWARPGYIDGVTEV
ncbi:MAG: aldo/keto reductase [Planctomycetota bacterium]